MRKKNWLLTISTTALLVLPAISMAEGQENAGVLTSTSPDTKKPNTASPEDPPPRAPHDNDGPPLPDCSYGKMSGGTLAGPASVFGIVFLGGLLRRRKKAPA